MFANAIDAPTDSVPPSLDDGFADDPADRGLTPEQQAAVDHRGGHLLIVAGAGTGKTTTLIARLASLIASGVAPEQIMLLTFSRRAATELVRRAEHATGESIARRVWAGTFHAIANRVLRRSGSLIGLDPSFTVIDATDTADLLALVRDELRAPGADNRRRTRKETMASILSRVVNTKVPLETVLDTHFPWCRDDLDELRATFRAYLDRKRADHVVDYDDMLLLWSAILRTDAGRAVAGTPFTHVLVDEYQDTNALQADILDAMAAAGSTITAVGDDAQAIYGFRAATVRNILDFPARFDATVVPLTINHRSTAEILATANLVAAGTHERHEKVLVSARGTGRHPELITCHDESTQADAVCDRLLEHLEGGIELRRQCVLVRTGYHSDVLELALTARNIPFVKYGGLRFLEAAHVKDLLCLLRVVENPNDRLAWFRVLQCIDGVGPARARRAAELADLTKAIELGVVPKRATNDALLLAEVIDTARDEHAARTPSEQIDVVRRWLDPRVRARYAADEARIGDLDRLRDTAAASPSLERFLTDLTLDPPASTGDLAGPGSKDDDVLTISTIHSAKGGEWDVVHVIHAADGCIPSDMAASSTDELDEERRLFYVALTRARDHLHVYAPLRYHHHRSRLDDAHGMAVRSRFLDAAVVATMEETVAGTPAGVDLPVEGPVVTPLRAIDDALRDLFG